MSSQAAPIAIAPTVESVQRRVSEWLELARQDKGSREADMLAEILSDPRGLEFTVGFVDRVVRPEDASAAAHHLRSLASDPPPFLSPALRSAVTVGGAASRALPSPVVATARATMRRMVSHLILDARDKPVSTALARYRAEGTRLNVNLLGEAVLGAREANRRLDGVRALIARDDIDYCSIKVSSIVDHLSLWGAKETRNEIVERLLPLYRDAAKQQSPTFINLDMEEFRDLELTFEVFSDILSRPELKHLEAGIVLQAYLPDALRMYRRVLQCAKERVESGGAPVKVRLVKGANLPMEQVEASVRGWPLATFGSKEETDAQYKRVLREALTPENVSAVRLGVAGHNLFDIAYALHVMEERAIPTASLKDPSPPVEFEMLAGMATAQQKVIARDAGPIRLYVPIVKPAEFDVAVSYLVRRLEENASSDNFMSALAGLTGSGPLFERELARFVRSLELSTSSHSPDTHRVSTRGGGSEIQAHEITARAGYFVNTPDTDISIPANQKWAARIRSRIGHSNLGEAEANVARVNSVADIHAIIGDTLASQPKWAAHSALERADLLRSVARVLAAHRAELLEVAGAETGKILEQGDPEVSEAIDFALYYADSIEHLHDRDDVEWVTRPLTLVTPPWNFPIAIPCGSILSALATGSAVLVKPAPQARRTGAYLVSLLHEAGIPREVLRLVDVPENHVGRALLSDPRIDQIILTGAFETAQLFAEFNPDAHIKAETSGKNAIIVTPHADLDLAVKDIVHSAFGHAGQKCSAASLVITVGSVTRSPRFHRQLADAVKSLHVGWPTDARAVMGPVIEKPNGKLLEGLTQLGPGEKWLAKPRSLDSSGRLYSPGVRAGVKEGSEFHRTEYFGPVTGLIHADTLEDAIRLQNGTDFGLTAGLHSLDEAEIQTWLSKVEAGNLYVNRGITGAIVQRQPFGGWKRSAVGQTAKAGGPNYLVHLMDVRDPESALESDLPQARADELWLELAKESDREAMSTDFAPRDVQGLHGEINVLRYCPLPVVIRISGRSTQTELERVLHAAAVAGACVSVSMPDAAEFDSLASVSRHVPVKRESAGEFARSVVQSRVDRARILGGLEPAAAQVFRQHQDVALFTNPVVQSGRVELLSFLREQAVSATDHRYGNPLPYDISAMLSVPRQM